MRHKLFFFFSFLLPFVLLFLNNSMVIAELSRPLASSVNTSRVTPSSQVRRPQVTVEVPVGYCCENGKVTRSTFINCSRKHGYFASSAQAAKQLCNAQQGVCCQHADVRVLTREQCRAKQGDFFVRRNAAERKCAAAKGFCLHHGKVVPGVKGDCVKNKGAFFKDRQAAVTMLATIKGFCCKDGKVVPTTQRVCAMQRGGFSIDANEAQRICGKQKGYCVVQDSVNQMTQSMCEKRKGSFFIKEHAAERKYAKAPGFCCDNGILTRSLRAVCAKNNGKFSTNRTQLAIECSEVAESVVSPSVAPGISQRAASRNIPGKSGRSVTANTAGQNSGSIISSVGKNTRDSSGPEMSYMQFSPMRMAMVLREDSFQNLIGDSFNTLKFNDLQATISCGNGKRLHTASITTGDDYFTYDAIEEKVTEGGKVQLLHLSVATFEQFSRDFPLGTATQTARIPIVLNKKCISDVGISNHRYERILEVDYSPWQNNAKILAAGDGQIEKRVVPSSKELIAQNLSLQQQQTTIGTSLGQQLAADLTNLDTSGLQIGFSLNQPTEDLQERTYWYVGNTGTLEDEFVHAPSGANPTFSQGITEDLQGNFSCGIGAFAVTPQIVNETNGVKILTPVDDEGNFVIPNIQLLEKSEIISGWHCYPGNVYFNKQREIWLKGNYKCEYADGSVRQFESERIAIPFQFSCDRRPLGNRPVSKIKLYRHECPDGYHIEGTNKKFIINEKGWNETVICEK